MNEVANKRVNNIIATIGGKEMGVACQASVELALGCTNNCLGCYASITSRRGRELFKIVREKKLDPKVLAKSLPKLKREGIEVVRIGKHHDPGNSQYQLGKTLDILKDASIRAVVVTKSMHYDGQLSKKFVEGNHVLHVSLGMISENAPSIKYRKDLGFSYEEEGVNVSYRLCYPITLPVPDEAKGIKKYIVTPLRFKSKTKMNLYGVSESDYKHGKGYYKPKFMNDSWIEEYPDIYEYMCGEFKGKDYSASCRIYDK